MLKKSIKEGRKKTQAIKQNTHNHILCTIPYFIILIISRVPIQHLASREAKLSVYVLFTIIISKLLETKPRPRRIKMSRDESPVLTFAIV